MNNQQRKRLILTEKELQSLNNIRDIGFKKTRSFGDYWLASGIQKLDLQYVKNKKMKKLFIDFLLQCNNRRNRTFLLHYYHDYFEIRIKHGFGYSWSTDVQNEFIEYLLNQYKINKNSKTYKNLVLSGELLNF